MSYIKRYGTTYTTVTPSQNLESLKKIIIRTKGTAMNGAEIASFKVRLARFTAKGLTFNIGEALADRLVIRDRESDDRRSCLECVNLAGFGTAGTGGTKVTVLCQQASDVQITPVGVDPLSV